MTKTKAKEEATTAVANYAQPGELTADYLDSLSGEANKGLENIGAKDIAIPFLTILQPLSPQVNKQNSDYVDGAEAGFIFNSVTKKFYSELTLVPVAFNKKLVEWRPRGTGAKGAPIKEYHGEDPILNTTTKNDKGQNVLPNGNILVETAYRFVVIVDPETGSTESAVITMDSTDLTVSRQLNAKLLGLKLKRADGTSFTPPSYAQLYKTKSFYRQNEKGQWYVWQFDYVGIAPKEVFTTAKDFYDAINKGLVATNISALPSTDEAAVDVLDETPDGKKPY